VLRAVTGRLKSEVRTYDAVGRYGGEEFLILLPGCDNPKLTAKAEQLVKIVERSSIETSTGAVPVTISIGGIASGDCPHAEVKSLLRGADTALYRAKMSGRNRSEMARLADMEVAAAEKRAARLVPEAMESPTLNK
jgi:two-component system cell cycle response regulator